MSPFRAPPSALPSAPRLDRPSRGPGRGHAGDAPAGDGLTGEERVVAVLGPTNTGKTFLAMERMLAHGSGMIGFPLRLLARENYDKVVRALGPAAVALVTGEERIEPPTARYWICTVEAMPVERTVQFLAVDEIQLAADPERGHIFTDRLLHARGRQETMFLGSDTIRGLVQKLIPKAEFISRPRFSRLTYAGPAKLTRLRPRSAIVAFSAADVYGLAELVRRTRGGTAVVLGALSPRTRNAQVQLYQEGAVDYLVATDAIGMGLNMDVDHVAFARLSKFDGQNPRRLKPAEIAQIAGRAGRHMTDGTFGTTDEAPTLDPDTIERVENHHFDPLKSLMWRNADLDFRSVPHLLRSLEQRPPLDIFSRTRAADDHQALEALARDPEVAALADGTAAVRLLWEVCQIPDFRKVMSDAHTRLLGQIFRHLRGGRAWGRGTLPADWVAAQVARLDRLEGDIDALVARIAHVRTWTYVSHRAGWLDDGVHWQERTRALEDRLSDTLHERLSQRFVDKRSAGLVKRLRDGRELLGTVGPDDRVLVEGHEVGSLHGLRFELDSDVAAGDVRALATAARRALRPVIRDRLAAALAAPDSDFDLVPANGAQASVFTPPVFTWNGQPVATLAAGPSVLAPLVRPLADDFLDGAQRDLLAARLTRWMEARIDRVLAPLRTLTRAQAADLSGPAAGIAFQVGEALGCLPRPALDGLIAGLSPDDRRRLHALGLRLGYTHVFLPALTRPATVALRALLWSVHHGVAVAVPPPGRVSFAIDAAALPATGFPAPDSLSAGFLAAIAYPAVGPRAVRADMLDRLGHALDQAARNGGIRALPPLAALIGASVADLEALLPALGWRRAPPPRPRSAPVSAPDAAPDAAAGAPLPETPPPADPHPLSWVRPRPRPARRPAAPPAVPAPDNPFSVLRALQTDR